MSDRLTSATAPAATNTLKELSFAAAVWNEGYRAGWDDCVGHPSEPPFPEPTSNPYGDEQPDRTRAAVVKALRNASNRWDAPQQTSWLRVIADEIENGANW